MTKKWGILSTGLIARTFAKAINQSQLGSLYAVASRDQASADAFGREFGAQKCYASYQALLDDPAVEVVYIAPPHPMHAEWAIKAAEAGKHILLEKPLTLNHAEAMAVIEAFRKHNVSMVEAFAYRFHPQTAKVLALIKEGSIGNVKYIQVVHGFNRPFDPSHRLYANELGGGSILDVGCYVMSYCRLVAGAAIGAAFDDPIEIRGSGTLNPITRTDDCAAATLKFGSGIVAQVACATQVAQGKSVRVHGSSGWIDVPMPYGPGIDGQTTSITLHRDGLAPQVIDIQPPAGLYVMEADATIQAIATHQHPDMTWDDSLGNAKALDMWREQIGLVYDQEKPDAPEMQQTVTKRHLRPMQHGLAKSDGNLGLPHGQIAGLAKPMSRLVMGVDNQRNITHASVMFDDFVERGGNVFDTGHIYGGGQCERVLGAWLRNRGLRDQMVILDKGAHTPFCTPKDLSQQLLISLDRLGTDHLDIYMMHRDNLDVPVGEFVDVLNKHQAAGHFHIFGLSNWTLERLKEADAYAKQHGLNSFSAISNNFSLARMIEPPWAGCRSASEPDWRAWLSTSQIPLMPWSSQARGFFLDRVSPDFMGDAEMSRCWYSNDNFERLRRARELAIAYGVPTIAIALAYVLHQPFPTFPLIGPRQLSETRTSFEALDVTLSADELKWLNLE
jgi:predicted dehydrogenase/aryl-alcohol dehydrogenase-like predicted oxidoreductase